MTQVLLINYKLFRSVFESEDHDNSLVLMFLLNVKEFSYWLANHFQLSAITY